MFRKAVGFISQAIKWIFVLTLPFTFLPWFTGSFAGWVHAFWDTANMNENVDKYLHEIKDHSQDWGVGGGAPSFRQFQDTHNDFGVLRINSDDFTTKLGFRLPDQYSDPNDLNIPVDKYVNIEHLVRDTTCRDHAQKPKEQWVWLSYYGFPKYGPSWDNAFLNAVRFAQGDRKLNQTGLYYAQCSGTAGFLCGVWNARPPTLVHFKVEDQPISEDGTEDGLSYSANYKYLYPVTVRIIEFPLEGAYTGLPSSTFPSYQEQVLAVMTGGLYEQFDPYNHDSQRLTRFGEYMDKTFWDKKGSVFHYINNIDIWTMDHVTKPLGIEDYCQFLHALVFIMTANAVNTFVMTPYAIATEIIGMFLGRPLRGDWVMGGDSEAFANDEPHNILEDLFGGAMLEVLKGAQDFASKSMTQDASARKDGITTTSVTSAMD